MDDNFAAARPGQLWSELRQLVAARAEKEAAIASQYADQIKQTASQFDEAERKTTENYESTRANLETGYVAARKEVVRRLGARHDALQAEHERVRAEAKARHKATNAEEGQKLKDARWEAHTIFEATKGGPRQRLDEFEDQLRAHREGLAGLRRQAEDLLRRRWQQTPELDTEPSPCPDDIDPTDRLNALLQQAQQQWTDLVGQRAARLFEGGAIFLLLPVVLLLLVVPLGLAVGWTHWLGAPLGAVAGLARERRAQVGAGQAGVVAAAQQRGGLGRLVVGVDVQVAVGVEAELQDVVLEQKAVQLIGPVEGVEALLRLGRVEEEPHLLQKVVVVEGGDVADQHDAHHSISEMASSVMISTI